MRQQKYERLNFWQQKNIVNNLFSQIISASRRTDIPSFFADWFMKKIRAGYVDVKNPYNAKQVRRVSLLPKDVAAIVFWTRDFSPMLKYIDELDERGYKYTILWTITGYPRIYEPAGPALQYSIDALKKTSEKIGAEKIVWRYDPIIIDNTLTPEWHIKNFKNIARQISRHISHIIISIMTPYNFVLKRMRRRGIFVKNDPLSEPEVKKMFFELHRITKRFSISKIQSCCQNNILLPFGIGDGACIDAEWLSRALNVNITYQKDAGQRKNCLCTKSVDIGEYNTCPRKCIYCYAVK